MGHDILPAIRARRGDIGRNERPAGADKHAEQRSKQAHEKEFRVRIGARRQLWGPARVEDKKAKHDLQNGGGQDDNDLPAYDCSGHRTADEQRQELFQKMAPQDDRPPEIRAKQHRAMNGDENGRWKNRRHHAN